MNNIVNSLTIFFKVFEVELMVIFSIKHSCLKKGIYGGMYQFSLNSIISL